MSNAHQEPTKSNLEKKVAGAEKSPARLLGRGKLGVSEGK